MLEVVSISIPRTYLYSFLRNALGISTIKSLLHTFYKQPSMVNKKCDSIWTQLTGQESEEFKL